MISSASIQQHRNEEKIDQATRSFQVIAAIFLPLIEKISNAGNAADFKVLPAAVRWNGVEFVWAKVALLVFKSASSSESNIKKWGNIP
jgi:hypothetical protein